MTSTCYHSATPKKLRSGAWGALIKTSRVEIGDHLAITTKAGKSWQARVTTIVWTGDDVTICATESIPSDMPNGRSKRRFPRRPGLDSYEQECEDEGVSMTGSY